MAAFIVIPEYQSKAGQESLRPLLGRAFSWTERTSLLLVDRSARERFHKTTVTRAFRHSGGHAGPFGRETSYIGGLVTSVVWVPLNTRMVMLAGVKSGKDTGQVPVDEVQVALLVDPSGAVTTTVTGVWPGAPVTSTTKPVQPISVQALGPTTSHPEPNAATSTRVIAKPRAELSPTES